MKFYRFLLVAMISVSCTDVPEPAIKSTETTKEWKLKILKTQKNTYTQSGQLDSTYQTEQYYVDGLPAAKIDFWVTRQYDSMNNLIKERTFQLSDKKKFISEETVFEYDEKNNLIFKRNTFQNVLSKIVSVKYNALGQKTQEVKIQKLPDITPENWNIDSVIAHTGDKQKHQYDTVTILFDYDEYGHLTKRLHKKANKLIETEVTVFANNLRTLTFGVNPQGDTISTTRYRKEKNLDIEVRADKLHQIYSDSSIYVEGRKQESVSINKIANYRHKETFKYDKNGNQIEYALYE